MEPSKKEIREWLGAYPERDRYWLAKLCEVEKKTVDNWLSSSRPIPSKALVIIQRQMAIDKEQKKIREHPETQSLVATVTPDEFDRFNRAALAKGLTMREWMLQVLEDSAKASETGNDPDSSNGAEPDTSREPS